MRSLIAIATVSLSAACSGSGSEPFPPGLTATLEFTHVHGTESLESMSLGLDLDGTRRWTDTHIQASGGAPACTETDMWQVFDLPVAPQGARLTDDHVFGLMGGSDRGFALYGGDLTAPVISDTHIELVVTGGTFCEVDEYVESDCRPNPVPVELTLTGDRLWTTSPPFDVQPSTTAFDPVTGQPFCQPGVERR